MFHFNQARGSGMIHLMPEDFELTIRERGTFYICLGYDSEVRTTAEIRFARAGEYRMGALKLIAQPMADYEEMVSALQARGLLGRGDRKRSRFGKDFAGCGGHGGVCDTIFIRLDGDGGRREVVNDLFGGNDAGGAGFGGRARDCGCV